MKEKIELLNTYIKTNIAPMIINFMETKDIPNSISIPATINKKELNGHYEGTEFKPPEWLKILLEDKEKIILVIDRIDTISKEEQMKFIEILKYRQISTFEISKDYRIILTAKDISKVSDEIKSLTAIL